MTRSRTEPAQPSPSNAPPSASAAPDTGPSLPTPDRHRPHEDLLALLTGTLFVALGVVLFQKAGLLTGGTAGLAFLIHYATGLGFGWAFSLVNLPFYAFAWWRMGPSFTLKTFAAVTLLSLFTHWMPQGLRIAAVAPGWAAVLGGSLCGAGMLILFRHRASLGGLNVLVLWLQECFGWRAGRIQMLLDSLVVAGAFAIAEPARVAWSVLGAVVLNLALAINHRPGRYMAV